MRLRSFALLLVIAALAGLGAVATACPFCQENKGKTMIGDFKDADMVVVGKFIKTRPGKTLEFESDFKILDVLKPNAFLKGKEVVTLPKYQTSTNLFLVYMDLFKGELDAYRGVEINDKSDTVEYIKGAIKLASAPAGERLRYAFNYLQSEDFEVSLDAYREFAQAPYDDYKEMATSLPADTITGWLQSPKTPPYRYGLYASLLGHAGVKAPEKYAKVLRDMIEDPEKRKSSGVDGLLAGYAMLQPREALKYLQDRLGNSKEDYLLRYACLRTVRFIWEQRPDLLPEKDVVHSMVLVVRTPDMADFAIEDLRRWNRWDSAPAILDLYEHKSHDSTLIKRAILRYALHAKAQGVAVATKFIEHQDAAAVRSVLTNLEREGDLKTPWSRTETKSK